MKVQMYLTQETELRGNLKVSEEKCRNVVRDVLKKTTYDIKRGTQPRKIGEAGTGRGALIIMEFEINTEDDLELQTEYSFGKTRHTVETVDNDDKDIKNEDGELEESGEDAEFIMDMLQMEISSIDSACARICHVSESGKKLSSKETSESKQ